jgi:hypothetical protein
VCTGVGNPVRSRLRAGHDSEGRDHRLRDTDMGLPVHVPRECVSLRHVVPRDEGPHCGEGTGSCARLDEGDDGTIHSTGMCVCVCVFI